LMAPAQRQLFYPIYEIEQQKSIVHYTPESLYILLRNRCTLYSGIFTQFPTNPNNNLISWDQQWSDYVQTMLFTTYLAEQFAGPSFITQLVANPMNGVDGINNTLATAGYMIPFQAIFVNWTIANFISDTSVMNGQYGYQSLDLPAFHVRKYITSYPSSQLDSLNKCAAHYYKLSNNFTNKIKIDFSFNQGGEWALTLVTYEGSTVKEVIPFSGDTITFEQPSSYSLDHLFLVVTNMEVGMGEKKFSFQINHIYPSEIESPSIDENEFAVYPNPATHNSVINFSLKNESTVDLNIFSSEGKFIKNRLSTNLSAGDYSLGLDISELEPGVYFITLKTDESMQTRRFVVL
ncbi:MAG: T9SS type A sorting domain-containing protein, partial [Bacteroidales bacterium]|nr:T9SS type A sorting domain-containing protein [Bacteroidales bacterium]MCF8458845.1 T9SS type A sorting domain-containing protein [Bacteroidales bacterium]